MKIFGKEIYLFDNIKIRHKLLGFYIVATLVPILFVGIYLNYGMRETVLNKTLYETDANMDNLQIQLNTIFDRATNISDLVYMNKDIKTLLNQEYETNLEVYQAYNKYSNFSEFLHFYDEIESIQFYMTKDMITNSYFIYANENIKGEDWYKKAVEKHGQISWEYINDLWTDDKFLTLTRAVYNNDGRSLLGVLCVYISPDKLNEVSKNEVYDAYISLDNEVVIYNKDNSLIGKRPSFLRKGFSNDGKSFVLDTEYQGEAVKINIRSFRPKKTLNNDIQISAVIPIKDVMAEPNAVLFRGFIVIVGSALLSILLINVFVKSFDRRVYMLKHAMNKVSKGEFNIQNQIAGKDEFGEVYQQLYTTTKQLQKLINEVYIHKIKEEKWKRKQKESEFKMLASQINPHFLYNTLEMIRMKALVNDDLEVVKIVKLLSKILRSSLEVTDKPIELQTELDLVTTYLEIQKLRFGEKIDYSIETHCSINEYRVFPLLLQPIVENSVIHGLEGKEGKGLIRVRVEKHALYLVIKVIDNGVGMTEEQLNRLNLQFLKADEREVTHTRIGLFNVHQRIKLHYGNEYGIEVSSKLNEGTTVTLFIPVEKEEHEGA